MTTLPLPNVLRSKLPALAATALSAGTACTMTPLPLAAAPPAARVDSRQASPSQFRPAKGRYPDPRYRPAVNFSELQAVAGKVAKATGREIHWRLVLGNNPGPLALIRGDLDDCTIHIHPIAARTVPPNTWAFIIGHEFAHRVESLGSHSQSNPSNELKADIAGARYAMATGYRLEAFLGWVLTEQNQSSNSHGSLHERVRAIAAHFGIPQNVIQSEARRYSAYREAH
jgi:hypothetical protein